MTKIIKYLVTAMLMLPVFSAQANEFAESPEWLALLHYQRQVGGSYQSTFDTPSFFLSPKGKHNPQAELEAAVALFQSNDDARKCLFPARYQLLKNNGIIDYEFPHCVEYEQFKADLQPAGVTLLFTDAFMGNPSSLFGHTLVRIDTGRKGTQLLAHGANYGAFTAGQENSVLYAVYGLTGGYYGGFTVKPYYDIINTYNNIENRDIWELNLDLSPEELDFFVAHLWEAGHAQSRYYFFTRNCSYLLMEMLDAVRPSLQLAQKFKVQAIPLDTVKAVERTPGVVKGIAYRPSRQAKIKHRYKKMSDKQKKAYMAAIDKQDYTLAGLDDSEKADVIETAYQFVQYQYVAKKLELGDYRKQSFQLLSERSKLKTSGTISELSEGNSPLQTHESMRTEVGAGIRNGKGFQEIAFRPAYHSLTDDNYGFLRGAEINFLNTVLRHYDNHNNYVLQKFDLVDIRSLAPVDEMFNPLSFRVSAAVNREMNPRDGDEGYVFKVSGGGGATAALTEQIWAFSMVNAEVGYGGFLPHNQYGGMGVSGGLFADFERVRILAEVEKMFATSKFATRLKYKTEAAVTITRNNALAVSYSKEINYGRDVEESMVSWRVYF